MKALFTLLLSLFTLAATAQVPQANVLSLQLYGGNGDDGVGSFVTTTSDGGFIIGIGSNSAAGTGNIDSLCNISGDRSIFLKYNSDASILEWSKCYAGNGSDSSFVYMFSTPDGGYILGGLGNGNTYEFLIHKENATGSILWSKSYGDSAEAIIKSMTATPDGGYIMVGETYYTNVDFPIHYGSNLVEDIGAIKVDSNGNKVWSEVIGGTLSDIPGSVINAPDGGCYIIGTTVSNDYDCTGNHGGNAGVSDAYLVRLDAGGNILWHKDLGGTGYDGADCAWPDGSSGVIIGGNTNSYDGDVTHYVGGIWALDVDSNGTITWNNTYGDSSNESPNAICKATDGTIWIASVSGTQGGEIDTAYGSTDTWFVHTDGTGNFLDAKVLGSSAQDRAYLIYPLSNGNVIGGGYYSDSGGAFPNIFWGATDAFLTIFAPWPESVQQINTVNNTVKIYPNPANEIVTVKAIGKDNYTVVVTDIFGREIYNGILTGQLQIPVKGWQTGIYYVQVISENGFKTINKLLVE